MNLPRRALPSTVLATLLCGLLLCGGCATTGPGGETSLILVSTAQEVELGAQVDASIREQYPAVPAGPLTRYVERVGTRCAAVSDRRDVTYHFAVLDADIINAFAAPGGYIYVTTGLLAEARSEAELATVLAHEMGHVTARHSVRQMQNTYGIAILAEMLLGERETMRQVAEIASGLMMLKYSRSNEFEADAFAYKYSRAAGYDPREMVTFFGRLQQLEGPEPPAGFAGWLSTHPPTRDRIQRYEAHASTWGPAANAEIGAQNYLNATASLRD